MTVDELARRRADKLAKRRPDNLRRLAGARRRPPPEQDDAMPGDMRVIVEDLHQIKSMTEEVMAEALASGDNDVVALIGALILHVSDVVTEIEGR